MSKKKKVEPVPFNTVAVEHYMPAPTIVNTVDWKISILGHGWCNPKQLIECPFNHRKHGKEQMEVIESSLQENGWNDTLKVSSRSSYVLNGNARLRKALETSQSYVPFTLIQCATEEEEKLIVALYDRMSLDADVDWEKMKTVLEGIDVQTNKVLEGYLLNIEEEIKQAIENKEKVEELGFDLDESAEEAANDFGFDTAAPKKDRHQKIYMSNFDMIEIIKFLKTKLNKTNVENSGTAILLIPGGFQGDEE